MISAVTFSMALYLASVLDHDTVGCFLALQETKFEPRNTANPPVDRQSSIFPAQSASEKPLTSIEEEQVICRPRLAVPMTYRSRRLVAVRCIVVGACKN
jgi:hypothetical protein